MEGNRERVCFGFPPPPIQRQMGLDALLDTRAWRFEFCSRFSIPFVHKILGLLGSRPGRMNVIK